MPKISSIYVPASGDPSSKLWFIGEAPGAEEEIKGEPFIGPAGQLLREASLRNGIDFSSCYVTNLCHYRPDNNVFDLLVGSSQLIAGMQEIFNLLKTHKPNLIVLLGNQPLKYLLPPKEHITNWRGSILDLNGVKCIPTLHPAGLLHNEDPRLYAIFDADMKRIAHDSQFPELNTPELTIHIDPGLECLDILASSPILSCDIETVKATTSIICVGFGISETEAYVLPYDSPNTRTILHTILPNPNIKKIFHMGIYDSTVLSLNDFGVEGYTDDTIIMSHILDPEMPRDLDFLTSIYTRQPHYKTQGRATIPGDTKGWKAARNRQELFEYNGKDCTTTFAIYNRLQQEIRNDGLLDLYSYEMTVNEMFRELTLQGLLVDQERMDLIRTGVNNQKKQTQAILNLLAGQPINVQGKKTLPEFLYRTLKLPAKTKYDRKKKKSKETTEQKALVQLIGYCKAKIDEYKTDKKKEEWERNLHILTSILKIRERDKLISSYLDITLHDGRAKSIWRADGTETGRPSSKLFVDDSGLNLMTIPRSKIEI
jgi:DNA polymerase